MNKLRQAIDRSLGWLLVVLMGAAVLNVLWQVFTRWVLKDPSSYTEELARYLLIWIGLLGAAYGVGQKLHLAIDILPTALSGRKQRALNIVIQIAVAAFSFAVMVVGGMRLVWLTLRFDQVSAALGIPLGYVYSALPLSGVLIVFYAACMIADERAVATPPGQAAEPNDGA
ncbi:MAG TPA: TRAP transporter small permease [Rhodothermales bacterium]|nr:TRAP transporter small permease [Rhodothermales bacterium]